MNQNKYRIEIKTSEAGASWGVINETTDELVSYGREETVADALKVGAESARSLIEQDKLEDAPSGNCECGNRESFSDALAELMFHYINAVGISPEEIIGTMEILKQDFINSLDDDDDPPFFQAEAPKAPSPK